MITQPISQFLEESSRDLIIKPRLLSLSQIQEVCLLHEQNSETLKEVNAANAEVAKIQDKIIELQASGTAVENPVVAAAERLGMKPDEALKI